MRDSAPAMVAGLTGGERGLWRKGLEIFEQTHPAQGAAVISGTEPGLGPMFNLTVVRGVMPFRQWADRSLEEPTGIGRKERRREEPDSGFVRGG